jgi:hypothetical protein
MILPTLFWVAALPRWVYPRLKSSNAWKTHLALLWKMIAAYSSGLISGSSPNESAMTLKLENRSTTCST